MSVLLSILYSVLPRVLNYLAANPQAWTRAVSTVQNASNMVRAAQLDPQKRQEYFATTMEVVIEEAKNPTRITHFLREAAVLYTDWKAGKLK